MLKFTAAGVRAAGLQFKFTPKRKENGFEDIESFWEATENIVLHKLVDDSEYLNSSSTISVTEDEDEDTEAELEAEILVPQKLIEDSDLSVSLPFEDDSSGADEEQEKSSNDDYEEDSEAVELPKQNEASFNSRNESALSQSLTSRRRRNSSDIFSPIKDSNNSILQSRRAKFTNTKSPFTAKVSPVSSFDKSSPNAYSIAGKSPKSTPRSRSQEISDIYDYPLQSPSFTRNKSRTREEEFGDNEDNLDVDDEDEEEDDEVESESLHYSRRTTPSQSSSRSKITTSPSTTTTTSKYLSSSPSPSSIKSNSKSYGNKNTDMSGISSLPAYEESSTVNRTTTSIPSSSLTSPSNKSRNNMTMEDISKLTSFSYSMNEKTFNSHLEDDDDNNDHDNTNHNDEDDLFDFIDMNDEVEVEVVEHPEEVTHEEEFSTPLSKRSNPSLKLSSTNKLNHSSRRVSFSKDTSPKSSNSLNKNHNNSNSSSFTPMSPIKMPSPSSSSSSNKASPNSNNKTSPRSSNNRASPSSTASHKSNSISTSNVLSPSPKKNKDIMDSSRSTSEKQKSPNKTIHEQTLATPQSQILQNKKNKKKKTSNRAYYSFDLSTPKTGEFVRGTAIPDESYREDDEEMGGGGDGDVLINSEGEDDEEEGGGYDDSGFTDTSYLQSIRKRLQNGKRVAASKGDKEEDEEDSVDNSYLNNTTMDVDVDVDDDHDNDDDVHTSREEEASEKKLRRSRRVTKGKTFQFWKNEGPVYREGRIQGWVTHDPTPKKNNKKTNTTTTTNNTTKRKRGSTRLRRELDLDQDEEDEDENEDSFIGDNHNSNNNSSISIPSSSNKNKKQKMALPPPKAEILPVILPNNRQFKSLEELDELKMWDESQVAVASMNVTCARPTDASYAPLPITADRPESQMNKIAYATHLFNTPGVSGQMSGWISGILKLPPGGIKDEEGVGECSQVFHVLSCQDGSVELGISDPEEDIWDDSTARRMLLKANDTFFIPRGNIYRLENHSLGTECMIFWTIIKPVNNIGEEDDEHNEEEVEEEYDAAPLRAN